MILYKMSLSEENHKCHLRLGFCTWTDHLGHFEVSANLLSPAKTQMHNFKSPWVFGSAAVKQSMSWSWLLTWAPLSLSHPFSTRLAPMEDCPLQQRAQQHLPPTPSSTPSSVFPSPGSFCSYSCCASSPAVRGPEVSFFLAGTSLMIVLKSLCKW